jgi:hypothetical protein
MESPEDNPLMTRLGQPGNLHSGDQVPGPAALNLVAIIR